MTINKNMRALSIRQPYAEQIFLGKKKIEYRNRPTKVRERVYIYASMTRGDDEDFAMTEMNAQPEDFPTGVLVGTVEIVDCTGKARDYEWHLRKPKRLPKPIKPKRHPQPVWFYPFMSKEE